VIREGCGRTVRPGLWAIVVSGEAGAEAGARIIAFIGAFHQIGPPRKADPTKSRSKRDSSLYRPTGPQERTGKKKSPAPLGMTLARGRAFIGGLSACRVFKLKMAYDNFQAVLGVQTLGQLLGEEYGAMLAAVSRTRSSNS